MCIENRVAIRNMLRLLLKLVQLTPRAKFAKASTNSRRISWLQANPKGAGSKYRARYECHKETVTIAAARFARSTKRDLDWDLEHGFLTFHDLALDPPAAAPGPLTDDVGGVVY